MEVYVKKRFTEEQIIGILREAEVDGVVIREICRRHNITKQTFFRWRNKYDDMTVSDTRKLKDLEAENARLKRIVAERCLPLKLSQAALGRTDLWKALTVSCATNA
jgi:putative transposase